ncbi:MAG TPA: ATP-binding protein [Saprospiraceae bacterium]|nr:ATP-binding protein [Saprospiraceae bacterium]HNT19134.1 ATP-binding protein [Saprospiraceae bacterium]
MGKSLPASGALYKNNPWSWVFMLSLLLLAWIALSQTNREDSLFQYLSKSGQDTNRVLTLIQLADLYRFARPQEAVDLMREAQDLAVKLNFKKGEVQVMNLLGETARVNGEYTRSLEIQLRALEMSRSLKNALAEANSLTYIGLTYTEIGDYPPGLDFLNQAFVLHDRLNMPVNGSFDLSNIGFTYEKMGLLDSALFFQLKAREYLKQTYHIALENLILTRLGQLKSLMGQPGEALAYGREALNRAQRTGDMRNQSGALYRMAEAFNALNQADSSLHCARLALSISQSLEQRNISLDLYNLLSRLHFDGGRMDSAYYFQKLSIAVKDSLFGPQKIRELQRVSFNEFQKQQKSEAERLNFKNRVKIYSLLALVLVFSGLGIVLYRNNMQKQKANQILAKTLNDLQTTQSQLIQSEKMASLGELTAGIAHEIQNPLNFVNNFSDVNRELIDEAEQEMNKGNVPGVRNLLNEIRENELKIITHGKRADAIVKGMLQHSRTGKSEAEATDLNGLADEYLRICYHGYRAKDKSFNVELKTEFDPSLQKISIVPQDIGRVILNLLTNAFDAVKEKKRRQPDQYEPAVLLRTRKEGNQVILQVKDNGLGIPPSLIDKIFQPFFTTKPSGQGTGLGLSLAYDIVKAHKGELWVESREGEYSEFNLRLPVIH